MDPAGIASARIAPFVASNARSRPVASRNSSSCLPSQLTSSGRLHQGTRSDHAGCSPSGRSATVPPATTQNASGSAAHARIRRWSGDTPLRVGIRSRAEAGAINGRSLIRPSRVTLRMWVPSR